jgi:uncharacterized protein (DUF486 family)
MLKNYDFIILISLIFLSSIIYQFSNFYAKIPGVGNNFTKILLISLFFALIEYSIKIPAMYYYGKNISSVMSYLIFLITIFICLILNSKFILKEDIHYVTYFTICLIIVILIFHSIILHKIKNGTTIFK